MYTIYLYQEESNVAVATYESDIIPEVGDKYISVDIPDGQARTVMGRLLNVKFNTNSIIIIVQYTYPNLVPQTEITQTENIITI